MNSKGVLMSNIQFFAGCILFLSLLFGLGLFYSGFFDEQKPDGLVYIAINGEIIKSVKIGHAAAIDFCKKNKVFAECKESFMGCGAFNCYCNFDNERIKELNESLSLGNWRD